jgi:hypothetical protein
MVSAVMAMWQQREADSRSVEQAAAERAAQVSAAAEKAAPDRAAAERVKAAQEKRQREADSGSVEQQVRVVRAFGTPAPQCVTCLRSVYPKERVAGLELPCHQEGCFRCQYEGCGSTLSLRTFISLSTASRSNILCCVTHGSPEHWQYGEFEDVVGQRMEAERQERAAAEKERAAAEKAAKERAAAEKERAAAEKAAQEPYGKHAGVTRFHKSIPRDQFGNVAGPEYDLSPDGTFRDPPQTILVMQLYTGEGFTFAEPKAALERKGFTVDVRTSLPELKTFCTVLSSSCQLWVVSGMTSSLTDGHCQAIQAFVNSGKGLFIWGDNDPYTADANALLRHLEQTNELSLSGNFMGDTNLAEAKLDGRESLKGVPGFTNHLVTTGLETLYEGITIAKVQGHPDHPVKQFKPLIRSSDGEVVTAFHDRNHVRIMIDGGFTRLYPDRWGRTAGTARFVTNAACWLYNHEARQAAEKSRGLAR